MILGIDLGTTNSLVAYVKNERPTAIQDCNQHTLLPSAVHYGERGEVVVGEDALKRAAEHPRETIVSVKRFMGRGADDPETRRLGTHDFVEPRTPEEAKSFLKKNSAAGTHVYQAGGLDSKLATQYGVTIITGRLVGTVRGDPDRVVQVLTNLLSNAIKFSPPGGRIRLSSVLREEMVEFSVVDQGRRRPAGQGAVHLRAVRAGGLLRLPRTGRDRARAGHQPRHRAVARRPDLGGERARTRDHVPVHVAKSTRAQRVDHLGSGHPFRRRGHRRPRLRDGSVSASNRTRAGDVV